LNITKIIDSIYITTLLLGWAGLFVSYAVAQAPPASTPPAGTPPADVAPIAVKAVGYEWPHVGGQILAVSFSTDGKMALSVNSDGLVKFWDVASGQMVRTINRDMKIVAAAFLENKKVGLARSWDGGNATHIMNITTGSEKETLLGHRGGVTALVFSPDGEWILSGGRNKALTLWGVEYGEPIREFFGHKEEIKSVIFSPNKEMIGSSSADKTIKIWSTRTGKNLLTFKPHKKEVLAVAFSPDGQSILSGGLDKVKPAPVFSVKLWDMSKKPWWRFSKKPIATLGEDQTEIAVAAFSPDGKFILSGDRKGKIKMWEIATGKEMRTFEENKGEVRTAAFSFDGKLLVTGGEGKLNLWDTTGENKVGGLSPPKGTAPKGAKPAKKGKKG